MKCFYIKEGLPKLINESIDIIHLKLRIFALKGKSVYYHFYFEKVKKKKGRKEKEKRKKSKAEFRLYTIDVQHTIGMMQVGRSNMTYKVLMIVTLMSKVYKIRFV